MPCMMSVSSAASASATSAWPMAPAATTRWRRRAAAWVEPASIQLENSSSDTSPFPSLSMSLMILVSCFFWSFMLAARKTASISAFSSLPLPSLSTELNIRSSSPSPSCERDRESSEAKPGNPSLPPASLPDFSAMELASVPVSTVLVAKCSALRPSFGCCSTRCLESVMIRLIKSTSSRDRMQMPSLPILRLAFWRMRTVRISFVKSSDLPGPRPSPPMSTLTHSARPAAAAKCSGVRLTDPVAPRSALHSESSSFRGPGCAQAAAKCTGWWPPSFLTMAAAGSRFSSSESLVASGLMAAMWIGVSAPPKRSTAVADLF
mmetsp:Transcript_69635/g.197560  ORF Transcript_69635/g.197560 Transcript_69635/m.197560 type:complete len:320 (-) Transcript_69635:1114-2073(-)